MNYNALFQHPDFAQAKRIVFFGNQSSFDFRRGAYLFDLLIEEGRLLRILAPEHGLFSEMQDQVGKDSHAYRGVECRSLYDSSKLNVVPDAGCFLGADALLVDIPDVGARYFTYTTHLFWLLKSLTDNDIDLPVFLIDRPNPAGTKVEGTPLPERYASFVGLPGLRHRHGMSTGQLADWMLGRLSAEIRLFKIQYVLPPGQMPINPSPNIPHHSTIQVYPGQCFWEATTWSEGRGTTRPFELFGHPDLSRQSCTEMAAAFNARFAGRALLRPTTFIPFFHKHEGRECRGFQLHLLDGAAYPTVFGALFLMRMARERMPEGAFWRPGAYEFDSECTAAQILIGDDLLIEYVNGEVSESEVLNG
ncbi:MAG: DUF1343 domain-containing protein [Saprospiraceae bacterium]|nr:DUF1343 domain-containing protein [Saprospiraceae bacterium]HRD82112.1 DUF1343 domain-containing protein [Saprospiraceae bacterium]